MRKVKVGDVLKRVKDTTTIDDNQRYKRMTIKMNHKGVSVRDIELGINIGTKSQFFIREGQFLLSKIDARNGAFGIVPPEADGAIITGNFWAFDVNQKELNIDLFHIMTSLPFFDELSKKASSGTTNRQYLDEKKFLAQEITLPPIEEQDIFITHFKKIQIAHRNTLAELKTQSTLIAKLRSSILSDAVSGRLIPQDPTDEPASVLLERIKIEKERLIKEGKLKRDKPLAPVTADEIPYELPEGWSWCRLKDVCKYITDGEHQTPPRIIVGKKLLSAKNVRDGFIDYENCDYISELHYEKARNRCMPEVGDLLIVSVGGTIGRTSLILENSDFALVRSVALIKPLLIKSEYLRIVLNSKLLQDMINLTKHGGAQPCLYLNSINQFLFPLPSLTEQHRIVVKVEKLMATCDALEAEVAKSRMETDRLMQTVLKEAFDVSENK